MIFITFAEVLHLELIFITFTVGITFSVVITFSGGTYDNELALGANCASAKELQNHCLYTVSGI